jgi:hypothetical protein
MLVTLFRFIYLVAANCFTGCFNKYQRLGSAISTCIYQFIVRSYHNTIFPIHPGSVKRMLPFYIQCLLKYL